MYAIGVYSDAFFSAPAKPVGCELKMCERRQDSKCITHQVGGDPSGDDFVVGAQIESAYRFNSVPGASPRLDSTIKNEALDE